MRDNGITLETPPIPCMSLEEVKNLGTAKTCNVNTRGAWKIVWVHTRTKIEMHVIKNMAGFVKMVIGDDIRNTLTENILQDIF